MALTRLPKRGMVKVRPLSIKLSETGPEKSDFQLPSELGENLTSKFTSKVADRSKAIFVGTPRLSVSTWKPGVAFKAA